MCSAIFKILGFVPNDPGLCRICTPSAYELAGLAFLWRNMKVQVRNRLHGDPHISFSSQIDIIYIVSSKYGSFGQPIVLHRMDLLL